MTLASIWIIGIFLLLFYPLFILPTKWVKIERYDHRLGIDKKVLQISDLHMEKLRVTPEQIKTIIERENPDYIFMTGDYLDTEEAFSKLENYLQVIKECGVETYAVLGNHDYYLEETSKLIALLKQYQITVMQNESIEHKKFTLVGIDDYCTEHHDEEKSFAHVHPKKPIIVLQHDPNMMLEIKHSFDLLLSGHLHGKQLNIPFLFWVKPMGILPKKGIYKGLHTSDKGNYYISKGIGQSGFNIRFFVRSELTVHYL